MTTSRAISSRRVNRAIGTPLQFCNQNAYTECMFSSPHSAQAGTRTARGSRLSMVMPRRPWAALAMIVVWIAAPTVAAACGVHCQTINLHACCQQRSMPMPSMPMPNTPASHRHMTNTPMPVSCGSAALEAASFSTTVSRENLSASAIARAAATNSSGAVGDSRAGLRSSLSTALTSSSRPTNRTALASAVSGVPLRI